MGYHTHPITVTSILEFLVLIASPPVYSRTPFLQFKLFFTSHLNKSCPSSHPLCPSTSDINHCFKFIIPFICPKTFNDSSNFLVWHIVFGGGHIILYSILSPGLGALPLQIYPHSSQIEGAHTGVRSRNDW